MTIHISGAEHDPILLSLGKVSGVPERYGADFMWVVKGKICAVQRKTHADFRASLNDGRLMIEVSQLQDPLISHAVLVLEGLSRWTSDGVLFDGYAKYTEVQHNNLLMSIQERGIRVLSTNDVNGTARVIMGLHEWSQKAVHSSLDIWPKRRRNWETRKQAVLRILQGFDGISFGTATKIYDHTEGMPLQWRVGSEKELMAIPGVGKVRAKSMWETLNLNGQKEVRP